VVALDIKTHHWNWDAADIRCMRSIRLRYMVFGFALALAFTDTQFAFV
jgi:hypothetical protein